MSSQNAFPHIDQKMFTENVQLADIAEAVGTPFYCYSSAAIEQNFQEYKQFLILDAAMNDFIRPSMYDAYHDILPLEPSSQNKEVYDIVGPVCETGDTFARRRTLTSCKEGDLLAIMGCGAYGAVMSSTYNTRRLIPEVMVKKGLFHIIIERISYDDLINLDTVPQWC